MSQNSSPNNVPDATKGASDSVAAPGCVGVGGTNKAAWLSVADFLTHQNLRLVLKSRARSEAAHALACASAAQGASAQSAINFGCNARPLPPVPDGNHGDHLPLGASHE